MRILVFILLLIPFLSKAQIVGITGEDSRIRRVNVASSATSSDSLLIKQTVTNSLSTLHRYSIFGDGLNGIFNYGTSSNLNLTSGIRDIAIGYEALSANTTGSYNVMIGSQAGKVLTGGENVFMGGYQAGFSQTAGSNNLILTAATTSGLPSTSGSNQMNIAGILFGVGVNDVSGSNVSTGRLGLSVIAPTARLHLVAGSATASTAPLKFSSGTPTTTPETGSMQFVNGLWIIDSSNSVRDTIATRSWVRNNSSGGGTTYTFSTGLTNAASTITNNLSTGVSGGQTLIGSTSTTSGITYKATTAVGTTGADHIFTVGSNGATEAMRILNSAKVTIAGVTANASLNTSTLWFQGVDVGTYFGDASVAISVASGRQYLFNMYNSGAANIRMQLTSVGNFGLGDFTVGTGNHFEQRVLASNKIGYFLRGAAGQTADLMDWADNTPTILAGINSEGGFYSNSSMSYHYVAKTTTYAIATNDHTIDCTSGTFTTTLPTSVGSTGKVYVIKNSGAGAITLATTSSQTIDGSTTYSLPTQYKQVTVQSNGANWIVISNN